MYVGDVLWEIHCVSRLNQTDIAAELQTTQVTVSRLMRNKCEPAPETVKNIMRLQKKYKIKSDLKFEDFF